jgi:hypothetical protein
MNIDCLVDFKSIYVYAYGYGGTKAQRDRNVKKMGEYKGRKFIKLQDQGQEKTVEIDEILDVCWELSGVIIITTVNSGYYVVYASKQSDKIKDEVVSCAGLFEVSCVLKVLMKSGCDTFTQIMSEDSKRLINRVLRCDTSKKLIYGFDKNDSNLALDLEYYKLIRCSEPAESIARW